MSSIRFLCHFCGGPLRLMRAREASGLGLSQEPGASTTTSPPAQGGPGADPEEGSASRAETDGEELQQSAAGWAFLSEEEVSGSDPRNFTLLGEPGSVGALSSLQRAARGVFDILAGEELDHPLCEDCTDSLLAQLDSQLRVSASDIRSYRRCLETRRGRRRGREEAREPLEQELRAAEREEARLAREVEAVEEGRERARAALEAARAETEALGRREAQSYRDLSELRRQQLELQDELGSAEARLRHARAQLARLRGSGAFRAAFEIRCDGPLAAINGCRLGRLPAAPVSWAEVGAAWGHAALLLRALARALGLRFLRYRLRPCGGRSRLEPRAAGRAPLPLFRARGPGSEDAFDEAMAAFLDCAQQFEEAAAAARAEPALRAPYAVLAGAGLMGDPGAREFYSVRTRGNSEERWTAALRCLLANLQCGLAWVSSRGPTGNRTGS